MLTTEERLASVKFSRYLERGTLQGHTLEDAADYAALSGMSRQRARLELISSGANPEEVSTSLDYAYRRQGR